MKLFGVVRDFIKKTFYYPKWRCICCGKEVFNDEYDCGDCKKSLPFIEGAICSHCGRKVIASEAYCSTCKNKLTATDKARSVFNYEKPVNSLLKRAKYENAKYLLSFFAEYMTSAYFKNYFNSDALCFVPMTDKSFRKRGYNQSKILAEEISQKIGVPVIDVIDKVIETKRQAKLSADQRRKNLLTAFRITDRKLVKGKNLLIIDDVTTTGSTAEAIAIKLKKAGAKTVSLLTAASVPPLDNY